MGATLIPSEDALSQWIEAGLTKNLDCILAVAYMRRSALATLENRIRARLKTARRFQLRVVFRSDDLVTEPAAIQFFVDLHRQYRARVSIRRSTHRKFHAKAYAFRRGDRSPRTVILGSANLFEAAIGVDSGELGISLSGTAAATNAWESVEDFWNSGLDVKPKWLAEYTAAFDRKTAEENAAAAVQAKWAKRQPRNRASVSRPVLLGEKPFVLHVEPLKKKEEAQVGRGREDAQKAGEDVPLGFVAYWSRREAYEVPLKRLLLEFYWTARSGLGSIKLASDARRLRIVDPLSNQAVWLVYLHPVRKGTLRFTKKDQPRLERVFRQAGWHSLKSVSDTKGFLRARRAPLLRVLGRLGWK